MDKALELRTPPPTRPLPSQADIDRIYAGQLLHSEADMFRPRLAESRERGRPSVPVQQQDVVDPDDMHKFVDDEDAVNAKNAANEQAYAQAAAAAASQAAAAGAAQDAIDQARQAAYNGFTEEQKAYIQTTNNLSGKAFDFFNSAIILNPRELAEVQPFLKDAAPGAAARGGKRKSKKYRYNNKSKKSKANKRRRSRSNKRSRSRK
jgi:hypothetical protein